MLTATVRNLERDGMLTRHVYAEVPPHVEYELTALGKGLTEPARPCLAAPSHTGRCSGARATDSMRGSTRPEQLPVLVLHRQRSACDDRLCRRAMAANTSRNGSR